MKSSLLDLTAAEYFALSEAERAELRAQADEMARAALEDVKRVAEEVAVLPRLDLKRLAQEAKAQEASVQAALERIKSEHALEMKSYQRRLEQLARDTAATLRTLPAPWGTA